MKPYILELGGKVGGYGSHQNRMFVCDLMIYETLVVKYTCITCKNKKLYRSKEKNIKHKTYRKYKKIGNRRNRRRLKYELKKHYNLS